MSGGPDRSARRTGIEPAIARIESPALGSAFAIDADRALTAWHCLRDPSDDAKTVAQTTLTFLDRTVREAKFLHGDSIEDWAVLELTEALPNSLQPLPLRRGIPVFEDCRCLGFPASALQPGELGYQPVMARVSGEPERDGARRISVSSGEVGANLDPRGLSGGPLVPRNGPEEAAGVMSRRLLDPMGRAVGGIMYACPAHLFIDKPILARPVPPDRQLPPTADATLRTAAEAGDAAAAARVGQLLREAGSYDEAEPWLREAANGGSLKGAFELGLLLDPKGDAIETDPRRAEEALTWFRKAATRGDVASAATIGVRLRQQHRDDAAMPWLESAAERDDAMAAHTLALIYQERGQRAEAAQWHRFGAEHGDIRAARYLGQILIERGDVAEARYWLEQAGGDPEAAHLLDELPRG
jgi:hypothetical protein